MESGGVCNRLEACPFYNRVLPDMPHMADRLMARYCHDDWMGCARKRAATAVGPENVPLDLFPNDEPKLLRLLAEAG